MVGGPSQMDLYDYKPKMNEWYDKDLPDRIRKGQRLTTHDQRARRGFPIAPSKYKFAQHGQSRHVDQRAAAVHARRWSTTCASSARMHTEAINHEPAITLHADRQPGHRPAVPRLVGFATASAR